MYVKIRHHWPDKVYGPALAPKCTITFPGKSITEPLASTIAMKTITLAPNRTWVTVMLDSPRRTHGAGIIGCGASSDNSPRCAASCCLHHWQIFFPNIRGGSCRPHRMQFVMRSIKEYQQSRSGRK